MHVQRVRLGRWLARQQVTIHQQPPHLPKGHAPHELLDVNAAIAKGSALPVRRGDLGGDGHCTFKT
jgi:hypothetical protein